MNCAETRPLLHACADGELDLVRNLEVGQHLKSCAKCAAERNSIQSLREALQQNDLTFRAPDSLRKEIRKMVRAGEPAREDARPAEKIQLWIWKLLAAGATAFAALTILFWPAGMADHDRLINEAVASHVRSLQANHLTDVLSSDQHTVKPWFDGKIDFAPVVKDFADQGFVLIGGRLDYLNGRTVAALVYRRNKHPINVFIWPAKNVAPATSEGYHGYSVIGRDANGMHYCFVSDLNATELNELARLLAP